MNAGGEGPLDVGKGYVVATGKCIRLVGDIARRGADQEDEVIARKCEGFLSFVCDACDV